MRAIVRRPRRRRLVPAFIPLLACLAAASACCLPSGGQPFGPLAAERLLLELPAAPEAWTGLPELSFRLSWRDGEGRFRSAWLDAGSRLEVRVRRGLPQALLAEPYSLGRPLRPAGALYPVGLGKEGRLPLDWRGGWAASVFRTLEEGGEDPAAYDFGRLSRELEARGGDPWATLAPLAAAGLLASGRFRADRLDPPPRFPVSLPGPGPWWPESPLAAGPAPDSEGGGWAVGLEPGFHRYYGPGRLLSAQVEATGEAMVLVSP